MNIMKKIGRGLAAFSLLITGMFGNLQPLTVVSAAETVTVTYALRDGDKGTLTIDSVIIDSGKQVGSVANVTLSAEEVEDGWKLDGYYVDNVKYSTLQIMTMKPTEDLHVEVRTYPDAIGQGEGNTTNVPDGVDDRLQAVVTFNDHDGSLLKAQVVSKGGDATAPSNPTRDGYTFTGWSGSYTGVADNLTLTAQYSKNPVYYTVTFAMRSGDKGTLSSTSATVEEGKTLGDKVPSITLDTEDVVNGWELIGYFIGEQQYSGLQLAAMAVNSNLSVEVRTMPDRIGQEGEYITVSDGVDDRLQAIVKFKDYDGDILKQQVIMKGDNAVPPTEPTRNGYSFTGWDKSYTNVQVDELIVTATYSQNDYWTIKFEFDARYDGPGTFSFNSVQVEDKGKIKELPTVSFTAEQEADGWKTFIGTAANGTYFGWTEECYIESLDVTTWERISVEEILNKEQTKDITYRLTLMQDKVAAGTDGSQFQRDNVDDREQFLITYVDWDNTVLKKEIITEGCNNFNPPSDPTREGYDFVGWDDDLDDEFIGCYFNDTTIRALYDQKYNYVVAYQIQSGDSGIMKPTSSYMVIDGEKIGDNIPDLSFATTDLHWKFVNYYIKNGDEKIIFNTREELSKYVVTNNTVVYIHTMPDKYGQGDGNNTETPDGIDDREQAVVRFLDYDWSLLKGEVLPVGSDAVPPEEPERDGYTFTGWDGEYTNLPAGVRSIVALYEENEQPFQVYFAVREGDIAQLSINSVEVMPGNKIGAGNVANVTFTEGDLANGWTFDGYYIDGIKYTGLQLASLIPTENIWVEVRSYPDIIGQGDSKTTNVPDGIDDRLQAVVSFYDYDNTLLKAEVVMKGGSATLPENPTRNGYTFTGWKGTYQNVTSNQNVIAQYSANVTYSVNFEMRLGDIGEIEFSKVKVSSGNPISAENVPNVTIDALDVADGWVLDGYYINNVKYSGLELATYIPTKTTNVEIRTMPDIVGQGEGNNVSTPDGIDDRLQAVVRFYDGTTLLKAQVVMIGEDATAPEAPVKSGYEFTGWDKTFTNIQADTKVYTQYKALNYHTVTFAMRSGDAGALTLTSASILEGEMLEAKNVPNVNLTSSEVADGWKFDGYYINGTKYTALQLSQTIISEPLNVEVRTYPDIIGQGSGNNTTTPDGIDDRLQAVVKFVDYNNTVLKAQVVLKGEDATAPANPEREYYTFKAWDKAYTNVQSNLTIKATYEQNTYKVFYTLRAGDSGALSLGEAIIPEGENIGSNITNVSFSKEELDAGWKLDGYYIDNIKYTGLELVNMTFMGLVEVEVRTYPDAIGQGDGNNTSTPDNIDDRLQAVVRFVDNNLLLKAEVVMKGQDATPPTPEQKEGLEFKEWIGTYKNVQKDETVSTSYEVVQYTLIVKYNGEEILNKKYDYNTYIDIYTVDESSFANKSVEKTHLKSDLAVDIDKIISPAIKLTGWDVKEFTTEGAPNVVVTPKFDLIKHTVTYTMRAGDAGVLSLDSVEKLHGEKIGTSVPSLTLSSDEIADGWKFAGYYVDDVMLTGLELAAMELTEDIDVEVRTMPDIVGQGERNNVSIPDDIDDRLQAVVRFYGRDNDFREALISAQVVMKGADAVSPAISFVEHYTFTGWDKDYTNVQSDLDVRAQYRSQIKVTYTLRSGDKGSLSETEFYFDEGAIYSSDIANVSFSSEELSDGWKLDGYYIEGTKYTGAQLASMLAMENVEVEVRTYPDLIGQGEGNDVATPDNIDDRLQAVARFYDYDDTLLKAEVVLKGEDATAPTKPTREHYEFTGWSEEYTNIQSNLDIYAEYKPVEHKVTYTLRSGDEGTLSTSEATVNYGEKIGSNVANVTFSTEQLEKGWVLVGYFVGETKYTGLELANLTLTDDLSVEVRTMPDIISSNVKDFTPNGYTFYPDGIDDRLQALVIFFEAKRSDEAQPAIKFEAVYKGEDATPPTENLPSWFKGWDGSYTNVQKTEYVYMYDRENYSMTFTIRTGDAGSLEYATSTAYEGAKITNIPNFTLSSSEISDGWSLIGYFLLVDGTYVQKSTLELSQTVMNKNETVEVRVLKDIVGPGDNNATDVPDGIDDRTQAIVRFVDYNDTLLKAEVVLKGEDATAPTPTREHYTFTGWDKEYTNVQSDITVKAEYDEVMHQVTYVLRTGDKGSVNLASVDIHEGTKIGAGNVANVTFSLEEVEEKWKLDGYYIDDVKYTGLEIAAMVVTRDVEVEIRTYPDAIGQGDGNNTTTPDNVDDRTQVIVEFVDHDNALLSAQVIAKGGNALAPNDPVREHYTFAGWDKVYENVQSNLTVKALYDEVKHTVTYEMRAGDKGVLSLTEVDIHESEKLGTSNVANVTLSSEDVAAGWKLDGYYIDGVKYTGLQLSQLAIYEDLTVEVRTYPDVIGQGYNNDTSTPDNIDDRLQAVVKFVDYDNSLLKAEVVMIGEDATAPNEPTREYHTFANWDKNYRNVQTDLTVKAVYTEFDKYTITYVMRTGDKGTLNLTSASIYDGDMITAANVANLSLSTEDVAAGWKFDGYYIEGVQYTGLQLATYKPTESITVEVRTYPDVIGQGPNNDVRTPDNIDDRTQVIVEFVDYDDALLKAEVLLKGANATAPTEPSREYYEFTGWDKGFVNVQENLTVKATYKEFEKYTITYVVRSGDKGTLNLSSASIYEGDKITAVNVPNVTLSPEDVAAGWVLDGYYIGETKYSGLQIATYEPTSDLIIEVRTYPDIVGPGDNNATDEPDGIDDRLQAIVSFVDYDYSLLKNEVVLIGNDATAPATPNRPYYTFTGWDEEYTNVQSDITVKAEYSRNTHKVTYVFRNGDKGTLSLTEATVNEGAKLGSGNIPSITFSAEETVDGWHFVEFASEGNVYTGLELSQMVIMKDVEIEVRTMPDIIGPGPDNTIDIPDGIDDRTQVVVKFVDYDNTLLKAEVVLKGEDATTPTEPIRAHYTFQKWDGKYTDVLVDTTVKAIYTPINHKVTFVLRSGDKGILSLTEVDIHEATKLGAGNVASVTLSANEVADGWKFVGYFIDDVQYTGLQLAVLEINEPVTIEVRTMPDKIGQGSNNTTDVPDDIDDRLQAIVRFYSVEKLLKAQVVMIGEDAAAPIDPVRTGYVFKGWDKAYTNIQKDTDVYAQYNGLNLVTYKIRKGDAGKLSLTSVEVEDGKFIDANVPAVSLNADETAAGWKLDGYYIGETKYTGLQLATYQVTENIEVEVRLYPDLIGPGNENEVDVPDGIDDRLQAVVQFVDYDNTLLKAEVVMIGDNATAPANPSREGYNFSKWDKNFTNVQSNLIVKAIYTIIPPKPVNPGCGEHSYWSEKDKMCKCEAGYDTPVAGVGCSPVKMPEMGVENANTALFGFGTLSIVLAALIALLSKKKKATE